MSEWKPASTIPPDWAIVFLLMPSPGRQIKLGSWDARLERFWCDDLGLLEPDQAPTHWMLVPDLPEDK